MDFPQSFKCENYVSVFMERRTPKHLQLKSSKESAMQKSKQSDFSVISGTSAVKQTVTIQVTKILHECAMIPVNFSYE